MKGELRAKLYWTRCSLYMLYLETLKCSPHPHMLVLKYTLIRVLWENLYITSEQIKSTWLKHDFCLLVIWHPRQWIICIIMVAGILTWLSCWNKKLSIALFDPGRRVETWRKRHSSDHGQPDRLHSSGGWLQAEQADQASLPGLQTGPG